MKLLIIFLLAIAAVAQEATPKAKRVDRIVEFVPDGTDQMHRLANLFGSSVAVKVEPTLGLVMLSGTEDQVEEAMKAILKYYKAKPGQAAPAGPGRGIELTLHILQGKSEGNDMSGVPAALNPVIQQMKQVTNLTSFRSLETQIMRVRDGEKVETTGVLVWADVPDKALPVYQFRALVRAKGPVIQCDNLGFGGRVPYLTGGENYQYREVGVSTSLDVKPGQWTVIGKTNASAKEGAIILVLSAKFVD
jgi:hypothetical protein